MHNILLYYTIAYTNTHTHTYVYKLFIIYNLKIPGHIWKQKPKKQANLLLDAIIIGSLPQRSMRPQNT